MKRIILPLILLMALPCTGQMTLGGGAGTSTKGRLVMDMQVSGEMGRFLAGGGFSAHLSNRASDPAVFYGRAMYGMRVNEAQRVYVGGGYAFGLYSTDRPELNQSGWLASVQYEYEMIEHGRTYVNVMYFNKIAILTVGLKAVFR